MPGTLDIWQLVLLALVQGLTEFLPVSSSAHLILPSQLLGWPDQGVLVDVMAHFGSLFAVLLYFRQDVARGVRGGFDLLARRDTDNARLTWLILVASPPALLAGAGLAVLDVTDLLRSPLLIAATTVGFGALLWAADALGKEERGVDGLRWRGALLIGMAQVLALLPGTSRSGITMTAARGLGLSREESARFSMLLGIPIIAAGGLYALLQLAGGDAAGATLTDGLAVAVLSFLAAYLAVALFMRWVPRIGMAPFALYRFALGTFLLLTFL